MNLESRLEVGFLGLSWESESLLLLENSIDAKLFYIFTFCLYIYLPDSQESDGGAIDKASNTPFGDAEILLSDRKFLFCFLISVQFSSVFFYFCSAT